MGFFLEKKMSNGPFQHAETCHLKDSRAVTRKTLNSNIFSLSLQMKLSKACDGSSVRDGRMGDYVAASRCCGDSKGSFFLPI